MNMFIPELLQLPILLSAIFCFGFISFAFHNALKFTVDIPGYGFTIFTYSIGLFMPCFLIVKIAQELIK